MYGKRQMVAGGGNECPHTPINMGVFMNNLLLWSFNFESRRFSDHDHQTSIEELFFSITVNLDSDMGCAWVVFDQKTYGIRCRYFM